MRKGFQPKAGEEGANHAGENFQGLRHLPEVEGEYVKTRLLSKLLRGGGGI